MRRYQLLLSSLVLCAAACGAQVVFGDNETEEGGSNSGAGGSGGTGNSGAGNAGAGVLDTTNSQGGNTTDSFDTTDGMGGFSSQSCETLECEVGQTICECRGECVFCSEFECLSFSTSAQCKWELDGAVCDCIYSGESIGQCKQTDLDCDIQTSCCGELFEFQTP